jgi:hypothetical protein
MISLGTDTVLQIGRAGDHSATKLTRCRSIDALKQSVEMRDIPRSDQNREFNRVERFFNRIKQCRRVATRYDKLAANYLAFVQLGRGNFPVPVSARWDGGVLMNQFPLAVSPLEAISFAHHEAFRIARL